MALTIVRFSPGLEFKQRNRSRSDNFSEMTTCTSVRPGVVSDYKEN